MDSTLVAMLVGGGATALLLLGFALSRKPVKCANCGREQPKMRGPANVQQAMWGGYTCHGCGADLDANGKVRKAKS